MNKFSVDINGKHAEGSVSKNAILVAVGDRACLAHNRWFTKEQAIEMRDALDMYIGGSHN